MPGTDAKVLLQVMGTSFSYIADWDASQKRVWYMFNGSKHYVYLRVFSDHTAEGGDSWGSKDTMRTALSQEEFDTVKSFLDQPDMLALGLDTKYEYPSQVHEVWDATLEHGEHQQKIEIQDFSSFVEDWQKHYPKIIVKLGCTIAELRPKVSVERDESIKKKCQKALAVQ